MRTFNIQNIIIAISNKTFVYGGCSKNIGTTRIFSLSNDGFKWKSAETVDKSQEILEHSYV